jgi:hypothetical protein
MSHPLETMGGMAKKASLEAMPGDGGVLRIDCAECVLEGTAACADCVVTFVVDRAPGPLVVTRGEARALAALQRGGLAPALRLRRRQPA